MPAACGCTVAGKVPCSPCTRPCCTITIASATLKNAPLSYQEWTQTPLVAWPAACFIPGVLADFDLPDCLRALGSKVRLVQPWGPDMQPVPSRRLRAQLKELGLTKIRLDKA